MSNLFKKSIVITDFHFGRNSNNPVANQDNLDFLDWAIDKAKSWGAETCIFMGDWHDNRFNLQISTLDYSIQGIDKINNAFNKVFWLRGNHDEYQRDFRGITSVGLLKYSENITLINDPLELEEVTFLPWLVGEEHKELKKIKSRYVFGHLELSGFMLNSNVIMPESSNTPNEESFTNSEYIFTGHYHRRQSRKNKHGSTVLYTGNVFPFNFSDCNDEDRGIMLLEWGKDPIFEAWPNQPLYKTIQLSELLSNEGKFLKPKMSVRVEDNINMSYEETQEIKDLMTKTYELRKFEIIKNQEQNDQTFTEEVEFKDVDQMVIEGLLSVESKGLDINKLVSIYRGLHV